MPFAFIAFIVLLENNAIIFNHSIRNFSLISDMVFSPAPRNQGGSKFFTDSASLRKPPANTVPIVGGRYPFAMEEYAKAESAFVNPLNPTKAVLARGKNRFDVFCSPCHGYEGKGDGAIMTKVQLKDDEEAFPGPPDYCRPETKAMSDARIFHIISAGQNIMFPHADRINEFDRWAIVLYVRKLQGFNLKEQK